MAQIYSAIDGENIHVLTDKPGLRRIDPHFFHVHLHNTVYEDIKTIPLYKFFTSIKTLSYVLSNRMLFTDRVESWDDCYENFFLKEHLFSKSLNSYIDTREVAHAVFGQSWTTLPESDALWRIYSSDKKGVRIQTSSDKLINAIMVDDQSVGDTWFGKVEYGSLEDIHSYIKRECAVNDGTRIWQQLMPYSQFIKRTEFAHEEEFRVIKMLDSEDSRRFAKHKRLAFDINPDVFIDSYLLDPRLDEMEFDTLRSELIKLGADSNKISKSMLYFFNPIQIDLD